MHLKILPALPSPLTPPRSTSCDVFLSIYLLLLQVPVFWAPADTFWLWRERHVLEHGICGDLHPGRYQSYVLQGEVENGRTRVWGRTGVAGAEAGVAQHRCGSDRRRGQHYIERCYVKGRNVNCFQFRCRHWNDAWNRGIKYWRGLKIEHQSRCDFLTSVGWIWPTVV